jgi:hypothetical protein
VCNQSNHFCVVLQSVLKQLFTSRESPAGFAWPVHCRFAGAYA